MMTPDRMVRLRELPSCVRGLYHGTGQEAYCKRLTGRETGSGDRLRSVRSEMSIANVLHYQPKLLVGAKHRIQLLKELMNFGIAGHYKHSAPSIYYHLRWSGLSI